MTDVEIRPLRPDDDMDAQLDLGERAFGPMTAARRARWAQAAAIHIRVQWATRNSATTRYGVYQAKS